ncbi:hypothetical protein SAMN05877962_10396 [Alloalcanivorax xenomutans]|uniref:T6SS effector BTH_I2691 family protein n=1 Tax=Alloalcanivorax xenomutans TaxID=1094342 RepID=UPI000BDA2D4F|nr:T6SS effector BTH_I2691 family protein [Alloalcanivorax xenomutans]SOB97540.1 hypothetical protein SAMN05877962_10396 [Alloalcanivorax xenomutans]
MTSAQDGKCPFCKKQGLPILPLRYAVARDDHESGPYDPAVPEVSGPFGADVQSVPLPEGQHYTLRLLRPGYLYVFNEVRGSWNGYQVTENGYLFPFVTELIHSSLQSMDPESPEGIDVHLIPPTEEKEFSCTREPSHAHLARCIMIPNADQADAIYMVFSDVAWTKRTWHAYANDVDGRRSRMRRISLAGWKGGSQPHMQEILEGLVSQTAESHYPWQPPSSPKPIVKSASGERIATMDTMRVFPCSALEHSIQEVHGLREQVAGLTQWAREQAESSGMSPAIVALEDPVGITTDLAGLLRAKFKSFLEREDIKRPITIASTLNGLQEALENQAELNRIQGAKAVAVESISPWYDLPIMATNNTEAVIEQSNQEEVMRKWHERKLEQDRAYRIEWEEKVRVAESEAIAELTAADLDQARRNAWGKYGEMLKEGQPDEWLEQTYKPALEAFDQNQLAPLAQAHVTWMESSKLLAYFDDRYDAERMEDGQAFADTLLLCLQDTQQYDACQALYERWLSAESIQRENLLLRAMVFNQTAILEQVNQEANRGLSVSDLKKLPWDKLITAYEKAMEELSDAGQSAAARVVAALMGPVMKVLDIVMDKGVGPLLISLGLVGKTPVVYSRVSGTLAEALDDFVRQLHQLNPAFADMDQQLLKDRIEVKSRGSRRITHDRAPGGRVLEQRVQIAADRLQLAAVEGDLSERMRANAAADAVVDIDDWNKSPMSRWQTMTSGDVRTGIVGVLLGFWSMKQQGEAMDKAVYEDQQVESTWRFGAAVAGVTEAVAGTVHRMLARAEIAGAWTARFVGSAVKKVLFGITKAFGLAAALVSGVWDFIKGWNELGKENMGMAALYFFSSGATIGSFMAFNGVFGATIVGLSATTVGIILAGVVLVAAVLILIFQNDDLQDWLERCYFGGLGRGGKPEDDARMNTLEEEITALNSLLEVEA